MAHIATRFIQFDDQDYDEGDAIDFGDDVKARDQLLALGAIIDDDDDENGGDVAQGGEPPAKPLTKMNKAELLAIVTAEQIDGIADNATNAVIVAAIEAKRAGTAS